MLMLQGVLRICHSCDGKKGEKSEEFCRYKDAIGATHVPRKEHGFR